MKWRVFSRSIPQGNCTNIYSSRGSISQLLSLRGDVELVSNEPHQWYPKGVLNSQDVYGYQYVDMHRSYVGKAALLVSEANCCVIFLLIDTKTNMKFAAHIAACSDLKSKFWLAMKFDFSCFFKMVEYDFSRIECYLFSNQLYKDNAGSFEQKNVMTLLSSLTDYQLWKLAENTHLIEGEDGSTWNHHCAVRLSNTKRSSLSVSLAN